MLFGDLCVTQPSSERDLLRGGSVFSTFGEVSVICFRFSACTLPHFFVSNPCVGRRFVDARDSQAPDALLRQLFAESPSAFETRPGSLNLAHGARFLEGVPEQR